MTKAHKTGDFNCHHRAEENKPFFVFSFPIKKACLQISGLNLGAKQISYRDDSP
jgi:hypothetical protein